MNIKSKIDEIFQSIKDIGFRETARKYKNITVTLLFVIMVLIFIILPKGEVTPLIGQQGCENFKVVINSYDSLSEEAKTKEMKEEVEKAKKIVKNQCN